MIVIGSIKGFIGAFHFLPEKMELQRRQILSPNSHTGRERGVCLSELESSEHLQALPETVTWPVVSSHQYWENVTHSLPAPASFGDMVSLSRNEAFVFLSVGI